jgi:hypothetical protein
MIKPTLTTVGGACSYAASDPLVHVFHGVENVIL